MISFKASEIAALVGGTLHGEDVVVSANPVIDSRAATTGSLFIAIKGERVAKLFPVWNRDTAHRYKKLI